MRTTLTLDDDVAALLEAEERRTHKPFKQVVNDALRRGLSPRDRRRAPAYTVSVHRTKLAAGIDPASLNRLADELEQEAQIAAAREREANKNR
jgi:hypothetical protein